MSACTSGAASADRPAQGTVRTRATPFSRRVCAAREPLQVLKARPGCAVLTSRARRDLHDPGHARTWVQLVFATVAIAIHTGCAIGASTIVPTSQFVYPNSNVTPIGYTEGSRSRVCGFLIFNLGSPSGEDQQISTQRALEAVDADILIDVQVSTKVVYIPGLVQVCETRVRGTGASMEVGEQILVGRSTLSHAPAPPAPPRPVPPPVPVPRPDAAAFPGGIVPPAALPEGTPVPASAFRATQMLNEAIGRERPSDLDQQLSEVRVVWGYVLAGNDIAALVRVARAGADQLGTEAALGDILARGASLAGEEEP